MIKLDRRSVLCLSLLAASLLMGWRTLLETWVLAWQDDQYTHILLILPLTIILVFFQSQHGKTEYGWDTYSGSFIIVLAIAIAFIARLDSPLLTSDESLAICMSALVLSWIGSVMVCFGRRTCAHQAFPLLFLFAMVPLPRVVVGPVINLLQIGSAYSTHALFALFNVPVIQHGVQLTLPGLTLEIAQECSSIRSSSMLVITTMIFAQVLLRSRGSKVLIVGLAVPLSVAKNGLRVFMIAMLAIKVDPGYLTGKLHHEGGILFLLGALAVEFLAVLLLRRREARIAAKGPELLPITSAAN